MKNPLYKALIGNPEKIVVHPEGIQSLFYAIMSDKMMACRFL